jgi:hypothetical protein
MAGWAVVVGVVEPRDVPLAIVAETVGCGYGGRLRSPIFRKRTTCVLQ